MSFYLMCSRVGMRSAAPSWASPPNGWGCRDVHDGRGGVGSRTLAGLRYRFQPIPPEDLLPAGDWPQPSAAGTRPGPGHGDHRVPVATGRMAEDMLVAFERFSRRRSGASSWRVWQDAAEPSRVVEQFVVASWPEHLRQHERVTVRDQGRLDEIRAMTDPAHPPRVSHWLTPPSAAVPIHVEPAGARPGGEHRRL